MTDQFFDELPRSERRTKEDEQPAGNMSELVLPPAADMLNVDELLNVSVPAPAAPDSAVSSIDILADLPPMPTTADVHPQPVADVQIEPVQLSVAPLAPTPVSVNGHASSHQAPPVNMEDISLVQPDPEPLSFSESAIPASQPDEAAVEASKKPASFFEKHKPKVVIGAIVLAIIGWNQYKKAQTEATAAAEAPVAQVAPYEAAIQHLQSGADNVSHLGAADSAAAFDGDDLFNGSSDDDKLFSPGAQPLETKPAVNAPAANVAPLPIASSPAQKDSALPAESSPMPQEPGEVTAIKDQLVQMTKERDDWKARALSAEKLQPKARPSEPVKTAASPAAKPKTIVERPAQKVVSTKPASPPVESRKPDVQYLGSFLVKDNWHAHMIIAGTVYEVSSGQKIAGLAISNVSATGAFVNGREYR